MQAISTGHDVIIFSPSEFSVSPSRSLPKRWTTLEEQPPTCADSTVPLPQQQWKAREERAQSSRSKQLLQISEKHTARFKLMRERVKKLRDRQEQSTREINLLIDEQLSAARNRRNSQLDLKISRLRSHARKVATTKAKVALYQKVSAKRIQKWWRNNRIQSTGNRLRRFSRHEISLQGIQNLSFEQLATVIKKPQVLKRTQKLLDRMHAVSAQQLGLSDAAGISIMQRLQRPAGGAKQSDVAGARILLSAYLMQNSPDILVHTSGQTEAQAEMERVSLCMLQHFEALIAVLHKRCAATAPADCAERCSELHSVLASFCREWQSFLWCFLRFKENDKTAIAQDLLNQYSQLVAVDNDIQLKTRMADPDRQIWQTEITTLKRCIEQHMKSICGTTGLQQLQQAEQRQQQQQLQQQEEQQRQELQQMRLQRQPSASLNISDSGTSSETESAVAAAAPPSPKRAMKNHALAHELMMDSPFDLGSAVTQPQQQQQQQQFQKQVQEIAQKAFFDLLVEQLAQEPPDTRQLQALVVELREGLAALTPKRADLKQQLQATLDDQLICQAVQQGALDGPSVMDIVRFIVERVLSLEAPARNSSTHVFLQQSEEMLQGAALCEVGLYLPELFKFAWQKLREIRADIASFEMQLLKPILKSHGVEYERQKFQEAMDRGEQSLQLTTEWLRSALLSPQQQWPPQLRPQALQRGDATAYKLLVKMAAVRLLMEGAEVEVPETLQLDGQRLQSLIGRLHGCTLTVLGVTLAGRLLAQVGVRMTNTHKLALKRSLWELLTQPDGSMQQVTDKLLSSTREAAELAAKGGKATEVESMLQRLQGVWDKCVGKDEVFCLMHSRVMKAFCDGVWGSQQDLPERQQQLQRAELGLVAVELAETLQKMHTLVDFNVSVYVEHYNKIIEELATVHLK